MKTILSTILVLSTCFAVGGCVVIQATEPSACLSQSVSIPGAPSQVGNAVGTVSESKTFEQDLSGAPTDLVTSLKLTGGQISLQGSSLDFLDEVKVTLLGDNPVVLVDVKPAPGATSVAIPALQENIVKYLQGGKVELQLDVTGRLPTQDFDLEVGLCVSAEVDKQIGL
jgi:hypothetical protein